MYEIYNLFRINCKMDLERQHLTPNILTTAGSLIWVPSFLTHGYLGSSLSDQIVSDGYYVVGKTSYMLGIRDAHTTRYR